MKKSWIYIVIALMLAPMGVQANDYKEAFEDVKQQFELRLKTAPEALQKYLDKYPYTVYEDEVYTMQGVLQTEKAKYAHAAKTFARVRAKNLPRHWEAMYYFYSGYAYVQLEDYDAALPRMLRVKDAENAYSERARYYAGYCYYVQEDYDRALTELAKLERKGEYKNIAPYYIAQIYYAQGKYDQLIEKAEQLLEDYDSDYDAEMHRLLGEVYYQQANYHKSEGHLAEYQQLCKQTNQEMLRNDQYLLGMSQYLVREYAAAVGSLKAVSMAEDTVSESVCLHLGHSYLRLDDLENAKLSYAAAIRYNLTPKVREEAMYNYVQVTYLQNSAMGESVTAFQDFIREYPHSEHINKVYALMADLYMGSKNYAEALNTLQTIAGTDAKIEETKQYLRYQMAVDAFLQGKMEDVLKWAREVIQHVATASSYKTEAYYLAAQARYALQDYVKCVENINLYHQQPNVKQSKNKAMATYLMGYALFNQKHYTAAEPEFRSYIATKPADKTYADALNRLGDCLFHQREFVACLQAYAQVANLKIEGADYALLQSGFAQGLLHQYKDKVSVLSDLIDQFPRSDYADDALYEKARALLLQNKNEEAIAAYERLLNDYPQSPCAVKASLEKGMSYRTLKQYANAIECYKQTIETYPGTEEAYAALEGLEQVYVETNQIAAYIDYTKQIAKINMQTASSEDSLVYVTAEMQYMLGNYKQAAAGLTTYLTGFCPGGRYCTNATYYAARSFYQLGQYEEAIEQYSALADIQGNAYMEEACMRVAELSYDKEEYNTARYYFQRMNEVASTAAMRSTALLGVLRCSHQMGDAAQEVEAAGKLLEQDGLSDEIRNEALYRRGKVLLAEEKYGQAIVDFVPLAKQVRTAWGAEAKYQVAYCYYALGSLDMAEQEVMSFTQMQTSHQYWLAKSMILLSDINVARGELFQAKQYLLALRTNYKQQDDIASLIEEKLGKIAELEQQAAEQAVETEEEVL